MDMKLPQRKSPVHYPPLTQHNRAVVVFVTVCSAGRKAIFAREDVHHLLIAAWAEANTWLVGRYVVMPDHIHLFCAPNQIEPVPLERWIQFWKSLASRRWPRSDEQPVWQKSCWDTQLRQGDSYGNKWEYVRQNPVRLRLVAKAEDWPYQGELNVLDWRD